MKVLIYCNKNELKPIGGPIGYLFNLQKNLTNEFDFLDYRIKSDNKNFLLNFLRKIKNKHFRRFLSNLNWRMHVKKILYSEKTLPKNINDYDAIHFHSTFDYYMCRSGLARAKYKGKIILTSHCPKAPHKEVIEDWISKREYKFHKKFYDKLEKADIFSFTNASFLIFPCEEALEPYLHSWKWFSENFKLVKNKSKFVATGAIDSFSRLKGINVRESLQLSDEKFIVCFSGRHVEVKGYDVLISLYKRTENFNDLIFLICGKNNCNYPLSNKRIEIGWTKDVIDYINAANIFILPNKETYFDLAFLEALSLGKIIIASNTGGNKYFTKFNSPDIYLYNTFDELVEIVKKIYVERRHEKYSSVNRNIYLNNFTNEIFAKNYEEVVNTLLKE